MHFILLKYTLLIIIIIKSSKKYTKLEKFCGVKLLSFGAYNARKFQSFKILYHKIFLTLYILFCYYYFSIIKIRTTDC